MFSKISWHSFILTIVILLIVYYIIIGILYYRNDILRLLKEGFRIKAFQNPVADTRLSALTEKTVKGDPSLFNQVHELMDELKNIFLEAASQNFHKEELLMALQSKLKNYRNLKTTPFQTAINNHISQTASSICNTTFEDSELRQLW